MKRAALYARVSGDLQGTIESQVLALKKQIAAAGHVLVKEYVDNGFSGPRFDRPALNEMRKDVKTDTFDLIYFHDADRIAREVTIQNIIIEEILKHRNSSSLMAKTTKRTPKTKFTLTILGAVAEFERAKIIERVTRGKQLRLAQGQLFGCGVHTFGYDYLRKIPTSRSQMIINDREAEIIRYVFETYQTSRSVSTGSPSASKTWGRLQKPAKAYGYHSGGGRLARLGVLLEDLTLSVTLRSCAACR